MDPVERAAEIERVCAEWIVWITALHVRSAASFCRALISGGGVQLGSSFFAVTLCVPFHWKPILPTPDAVARRGAAFRIAVGRPLPPC